MKQVSAFQKLLAVLGLVTAIGGGLLLGILASGGLGQRNSALPALPASPHGHASPLAGTIVFSIVLTFLSAIALFGGTALYWLIMATRLFIFDFSRPVWSSFKRRLFIANIFVPLMGMIGLSGLVAASGSPFLATVGVTHETAFLLLFLAPFILLQLTSTWLAIWTPLVGRLTRSRLLAIGIEPARIDQGTLLGISDPAKKSLRKLGLVEEDVGMLWITPDELVYKGDNDAFCVRRDQLVSIERVADAGSVSAYFGNVHIILAFARDGAAPRRVRLHPESSWTMTGTARASDHLANALDRWKGPAPAVPAETAKL
jgi:hypothetical protein